MSYELVSGEGWKRTLKFRIPAEDVQAKYAESLKQAQKLYSLPGFRPGKVPVQIIEKRLSEQLIQDALEAIRHDSFEAALKADKIGALGVPHFADDEPYTRGGDYLFSAEFEIEPDFELPQYKGMELQKPKAEVTDEDVNAEIESLRFRSGKWEPTEGRAVENTDRITALVEIYREGELVGSLENTTFTSRSNGLRCFDLPNLSDAMAGAVAGDEREIISKVNDIIAGVEVLSRGDDVTLKIKVKEVSVLHLPELNDEFAKMHEHDSLADMRDALRHQLVHYKADAAEKQLRTQMIQKLTEGCDFEPPVEITARQAKANYERELSRYRRMGIDIEQFEDGRHLNAFRTHAATDARNTIKMHFIVDKIAGKERIFCTESELVREIEMMANHYNTSPQKMRQMLEDEDMLEQIRVDIRERKVFDLILAKATITEVDAPPEPMDHDDDQMDDVDDHEHEHEHDEACDCGHDH